MLRNSPHIICALSLLLSSLIFSCSEGESSKGANLEIYESLSDASGSIEEDAYEELDVLQDSNNLEDSGSSDISEELDAEGIQDSEDKGDSASGLELPANIDASLLDDTKPSSFSGLETGYIPGGIIGRYYDGPLENPGDEPGAVFFQRLETELSLTKTENSFAAFNNGELFSAHFEGALFVEDKGTYRIMVSASDSVRLKLHEEVLLEVWKAKQLYTAQVLVELEPGWHPMELVYARDDYRAHIQLWMAPEDEDVELVSGDAMGYPDTPPEEPESTTIEASEQNLTSYTATYALRSDLPLRFSAQVNGSVVTENFEDIYHTETEATLQLQPGQNHSVVFLGVDPWGREFTSEPLELVTTEVPVFTPGGILGTYHSGTSFETPVGIRLDPRLHLPQDADGDKSGCFQSAMPDNNFSVRWEGGLKVEEAGEYTLWLGSDDGQRLYLDGVLIAHNWTGHALAYVQKTLYLATGWHPLTIELYEGGGSAEIHLEWEQEGKARTLIPAENLGSIIPEQPAEAPAILSFESEASGENIKAIWTASKLSTTTITILSEDTVDGEVAENQQWEEAKAVLENKCSSCHTSGSSGGWSTEVPDTIQLDTGSCADGKIFDCILERIQDGSMPPGNQCTGDPSIDGDAADCLTESEQGTISAWVLSGGEGPPPEPETINFDALSTGFSYKFTNIPEAGIPISIQLKDSMGQTSPPQEYLITAPAE